MQKKVNKDKLLKQTMAMEIQLEEAIRTNNQRLIKRLFNECNRNWKIISG